MLTDDSSPRLPDYETLSELLLPLELPISLSEIHGLLCGYLALGADSQAETYLRALLSSKKNTQSRTLTLALFELHAISQQQLAEFGFDFQMLLPNEEASLNERAQAFSDWCEGFSQAITLSGLAIDTLDDDTQNALQHITEFADLDHESLHVDEDDERALLDITEYTRMAVIQLYTELHVRHHHTPNSDKAH